RREESARGTFPANGSTLHPAAERFLPTDREVPSPARANPAQTAPSLVVARAAAVHSEPCGAPLHAAIPPLTPELSTTWPYEPVPETSPGTPLPHRDGPLRCAGTRRTPLGHAPAPAVQRRRGRLAEETAPGVARPSCRFCRKTMLTHAP